MESIDLENSSTHLNPKAKLSVQHNLEKDPLQTGRMESTFEGFDDPHAWSWRMLTFLLIFMLLSIGIIIDRLAGGIVTGYVDIVLEIARSIK
jgi:hypothetical protein